ncbi:MRPL10 [Candida pseudojiufengensis]|uniref:MRPL10 n=1 Tax=Candida pseudojiufengensis TaxID=497109 RepID=UPI0022241081|nr:MRPL10 [Candida pseudojiufengensis]KAI5964796.1 MRPL10 [Candida pseudojiufengensis]
MFKHSSFIDVLTSNTNKLSLYPIRTLRTQTNLGSLSPNEGSTQGYKRLGRGPSSNKGKTSGRGQKGQKARGKVPIWMEGGQTPYFKQMPMVGFKNHHNAKQFHELNLSKIQDFWENNRIPLQRGETLTIKIMKDCGLITGTLKDGVKILGNNLLNKKYNVPLNIEASKATEQAIIKIEKDAKMSFTARYFSKLGLRAFVNPSYFLLRKGYVPLQARPISQKDITFYSNQKNRGYLEKDSSILLDHLAKAKEELKTTKPKKKSTSKFKSLTEQLKEASSINFKPTNNTISVKELTI